MTNGTTPIELQTAVSRSTELIFTDVGGDVTMMSVETGKYYVLKSVGARIWSLIEQPATLAHICDRLVGEYRIDRSRCENEVLTFVRRMHDEGVVRIATSES